MLLEVDVYDEMPDPKIQFKDGYIMYVPRVTLESSRVEKPKVEKARTKSEMNELIKLKEAGFSVSDLVTMKEKGLI